MRFAPPGKSRAMSAIALKSLYRDGATQVVVEPPDFNIEKCERRGGDVKLIASIEEPEVMEKILTHLGL